MLSNRLTFLAAEIKMAAAILRSAQRTAADAAIVAGRSLIEAKALLEHGEWLPFLKKAGINERAAQRLMVVGASGLKSDVVSDLGGVTATLRFLALRKLALRLFEEGEAEAVDGNDSDASMRRVMDVLSEMVAMLPPEFVAAHRARRARAPITS